MVQHGELRTERGGVIGWEVSDSLAA